MASSVERLRAALESATIAGEWAVARVLAAQLERLDAVEAPDAAPGGNVVPFRAATKAR